MTNKERSVEEIAQEIQDRFFALGARIKKEDYEYLTQTLQTERQKREEAVEAERERIKKYLYEKSHAGFDEYGDEYERYVHWCYIIEALTQPYNK